MKTPTSTIRGSIHRPLTLALAAIALTAAAFADPALNIDAGISSAKVSPTFYGLMTEEINHSYDGGLYAELIQNRSFLDDASAPVHWTAIQSPASAAAISLDRTQPPNANIPVSLKLDVTKATQAAPAGVSNEGYWGFPITADTTYKVSFFARASAATGPVTVSLQSDDGATIFATADVASLTTGWAQYSVTLKTAQLEPTTRARFALTLASPATLWLSCVSVFPPTANDQPNGFRKDILQMMVDMRPKFLRFPGGNFLEGDTLADRFDWKKTLGPISQRPGHQGPWSYRVTDGMGLAEFLMWCDDMNAQPLLAVNAGYALKGAFVKPGHDLEPYVQDALDEIEYLIGPTTSTWGAQRARDGHPAPFNLHYVEIGNEDFFDKSGTYDARFTQFFDAIKSRYPQLLCISTVGNEQPAKLRVHSRRPDAVDEHYYRSAAQFLKMAPRNFDHYSRSGPKIFVGEWAAYEDIVPWAKASKGLPPTPSMKSALGDAAWMAGMERNSDIIVMNCYAPLLVNVNPGAYQWRPDMIGYDALHSFGSPSYYAFQMFSQNIGDEILKVTPTGTSVQAAVTRNSSTHEIFIKLVNPDETPAPLAITFDGGGMLSPTGTAITLAADPLATNSIDDPKKVIPVTTPVTGISSTFTYTVPAHAILVLKLKAS
jgi:alpha-N-arabinofuranosidase